VDLLPELALGVLADPDADSVRSHLAECESCRAEYDEMTRVAKLLPLVADDAAPSPAVKDGLLERIAHEPRPLPLREARSAGRPAWWLGAIAAGVAALLVLAGAAGYALHSNDNSDLKRANADQAQVLAAVARGDAHTVQAQSGQMKLTLISAPQASEAFAYVTGMPALPEGKAYQAWFSKDGKTFEPSTVFTTNDGGVWLSANSALNGYSTAAFTIEDSAGARQPTQQPFAAVDLKGSAMAIR
jgi:hypothetical protein